MKYLPVFFFLYLFIGGVHAQVVSSCTGPDSIELKYKTDAQRLALRQTLRRGSKYKDSATISPLLTDTVLRALIAVYNATSLPARDTVIGKFNLNVEPTPGYDIHTFPFPVMNNVLIAADSDLAWMEQFKAGNTITGDPAVDGFTTRYHFSFQSYFSGMRYGLPFDEVTLISDSNYNLTPILDSFLTITGMQYAEGTDVIGDGNDITDSIYPGFVELVYSLGWGDCPSGCIARRFWKFHVYPDCSVEFVGSYGTPIIITSSEKVSEGRISVYPNPFSESVSVKGIGGVCHYRLLNIYGEEVDAGALSNNNIYNLDNLPGGLYFLEVYNDSKSFAVKLVKEN